MTTAKSDIRRTISAYWYFDLFFGYGIGAHARSDAMSVFFIWLISSFSMGVLLFLVPFLILRRSLLKAWRKLVDWRNFKALMSYRSQFADCKFNEVGLNHFVPKDAMHTLNAVSERLKRSELPRLFFVDVQESSSSAPGAFTTFFFVKSAPIIICPARVDNLTLYQRFIIYHELGHASGFHTAHSLRTALTAINSALILWMMLIAGLDHYWGALAIGIYLAVSVIDYLVKPSEKAAESYADAWGRWGLAVEQRTPAEINDVLRLRDHHLHRSVGKAAADQQRAIVEKLERRNADFAKYLLDKFNAAIKRGAIIEHRIEHRIGNDFSDGLYGAVSMQELDDPIKSNQAIQIISFLNGIVCPFFIGISFAPIVSSTAFIALGVSMVVAFFLEVVIPDQVTPSMALGPLPNKTCGKRFQPKK